MKVDNDKYAGYFSESKLWEKIISIPRKAGKEIIHKALVLYVILCNKNTPAWVKLAIIAVLGYLICPLDLVPDFIPIAGYLDDLAAIVMLLAELSVYETKNTKDRADKLEKNILG